MKMFVMIFSFLIVLPVFAASTTYNAKVGIEQGGDRGFVKSGGSFDVESGGEIDIESGGSLKLAGTAISATASEINTAYVFMEIADISGANSDVTVSPVAGTVSLITCAVSGDPGAQGVITPSINGTSITSGAVTIANGASAYEKDTSTPTAANTVAVGDTLKILSDATPSNAVAEYCVLAISL